MSKEIILHRIIFYFHRTYDLSHSRHLTTSALTCLHVVPIDLHPIVPDRGALHVHEANVVRQLVEHNHGPHAAVVGQVVGVGAHALVEADVGITAGRASGETDEVALVGATHEAHASFPNNTYV